MFRAHPVPSSDFLNGDVQITRSISLCRGEIICQGVGRKKVLVLGEYKRF